jgi:hypothetical protein
MEIRGCATHTPLVPKEKRRTAEYVTPELPERERPLPVIRQPSPVDRQLRLGTRRFAPRPPTRLTRLTHTALPSQAPKAVPAWKGKKEEICGRCYVGAPRRGRWMIGCRCASPADYNPPSSIDYPSTSVPSPSLDTRLTRDRSQRTVNLNQPTVQTVGAATSSLLPNHRPQTVKPSTAVRSR